VTGLAIATLFSSGEATSLLEWFLVMFAIFDCEMVLLGTINGLDHTLVFQRARCQETDATEACVGVTMRANDRTTFPHDAFAGSKSTILVAE
jgi:hypothetical protein